MVFRDFLPGQRLCKAIPTRNAGFCGPSARRRLLVLIVFLIQPHEPILDGPASVAFRELLGCWRDGQNLEETSSNFPLFAAQFFVGKRTALDALDQVIEKEFSGLSAGAGG